MEDLNKTQGEGRKIHVNYALCLASVSLAAITFALKQKGLSTGELDLNKGLAIATSSITFLFSRTRSWYYGQITPGMENFDQVTSVRRNEVLVSVLTTLSGLSQLLP